MTVECVWERALALEELRRNVSLVTVIVKVCLRVGAGFEGPETYTEESGKTKLVKKSNLKTMWKAAYLFSVRIEITRNYKVSQLDEHHKIQILHNS